MSQHHPLSDSVKNITISQLWNHFSEEAINPAAPLIQFEEMQKAYYAGMITAIHYLLEAAEEELSEEEGEKVIDNIHTELEQWFENLNAVQ